MKDALDLLSVIKQDKERVDLLLPLQRQLIRQLIIIEKRITYLKKARSRLQNQKKKKRSPSEVLKVKKIKSLIKMCDERAKEYHHQRFLWRCVGDGIAAVYQSKYSLKHLYFDMDYKPKQEPGFLSGKTGFKNEYKMLVKGIQMGVPVVLSDLTNIIRHGDLCALAGEEPVPIEMKSSDNRNSRTDRQLEQLKELNTFYSYDEIENYRGIPLTKRVALTNKEINYEHVINDCIEKAISNSGFAISNPESGLRYFAFTNEWVQKEQLDFEQYFGKPMPHSVIVHITCDERLLPSYPFVLSMNPRNALLFMQDSINIVVVIDLQEVKSKFKIHGLHAVALLDGMHALQVMFDKQDIFKGVFRISELNFLRVATEFLSLEWFVGEQAQVANKFNLEGSDIIFDERSLVRLQDWQNAKDCFEDL